MEAADIKKETSRMLSIMNVVIDERDRKGERKRDIKFKGKREERKKGGALSAEGPSLVESIFKPQPDAFKG